MYRYSIVITTYNRRALLTECLGSLSAMSFDTSLFEVCIVNDGSSDDTAELLRQRSYPYACRMITIANAGPSNARNVGAQNAAGEFIVFLEDDVNVRPDWLTNADAVLSGGSVDVLEGRTIYQTTKKDVRRFDDDAFLSFIPCNLFVRRSVFLQSGGYDPSFYSPEGNFYFRDDTELGFRMMGRDVRIAKSGQVIVEHPEQFSDVSRCLRHAMRYQFDALLYKKHPALYRSSIDVKKIAGITFHRPHHYVYFGYIILSLMVPAAAAGLIPLSPLIPGGGLIILAFLIRFKYQGLRMLEVYRIIDTAGFFLLPYVYAFAFIKGCYRYRSYGALL